MKKHAIIPIFISHRGCPNDCVFCNQKKITAREGDVKPEDVRNTIEQWLTTLADIETVEVSCYGGSFTGIPMEQQTEFALGYYQQNAAIYTKAPETKD